MRDQGSITVESVLLVPAAVAMLMLIGLAGRAAWTLGEARHAADQAARHASQLSTASFTGAAVHGALRDLQDEGGCAVPQIGAAAGTAFGLRTVTVSVSCTVDDSGVALVGRAPRVSVSSTDVYDRFRADP